MKTFLKNTIITGILSLTAPFLVSAQIDARILPATEVMIDPVLTTDTLFFDYPTLIIPDITNTDVAPPPDDNITLDPDTQTDPIPSDQTPEPTDSPTNTGTYIPPDTTAPEPTDDPTRATEITPEPSNDPEPGTTGTFVPAERPPLIIPGNTFTPRTPIDPDRQPEKQPEEPTEECPPFNPLDREPVECPKVETVPVIPIPPYILLLTPLLAVFLFWAIMSYFNRAQNRLENRFIKKHLQMQHQKSVNSSKMQTYRKMMDLLIFAQSSPTSGSSKELQSTLSKIELLGSEEAKTISQQAKQAITSGDKNSIKKTLKDLAQQIRKES